MNKNHSAAVAALAVALGFATPAAAQSAGIITSTELDAALAAPASNARADVTRWLESERVAAAARSIGTDLRTLTARVATMSDAAVRELAAQASADERQLAGGDQKVVIGTTTIIIALLVLILIT